MMGCMDWQPSAAGPAFARAQVSGSGAEGAQLRGEGHTRRGTRLGVGGRLGQPCQLGLRGAPAAGAAGAGGERESQLRRAAAHAAGGASPGTRAGKRPDGPALPAAKASSRAAGGLGQASRPGQMDNSRSREAGTEKGRREEAGRAVGTEGQGGRGDARTPGSHQRRASTRPGAAASASLGGSRGREPWASGGRFHPIHHIADPVSG